jgi:hypothetical protein
MKKYVTLLSVLLATTSFSIAQSGNSTISFNGFYIAKTGSIEAAKADIYTYLRFYKDGTVYLQAVSSFNPEAVSKWFGRYKKFSEKGTYTVNDSSISISTNNKESEDFKLGVLEDSKFTGTIRQGNQLYLKRDNGTGPFTFLFSPVADTTRIKYAQFKPLIKIPGEWKVKQILKNSGQIFLANEDSSAIGIMVLMASKLPGYKEGLTDFEMATVYYKWDSDYMKEDEKMEVHKISENVQKAFITWNTKDKYNDNNFLFAKHGDLLYNFMINDPKMPLEKQLSILEMLYDLNKD